MGLILLFHDDDIRILHLDIETETWTELEQVQLEADERVAAIHASAGGNLHVFVVKLVPVRGMRKYPQKCPPNPGRPALYKMNLKDDGLKWTTISTAFMRPGQQYYATVDEDTIHAFGVNKTQVYSASEDKWVKIGRVAGLDTLGIITNVISNGADRVIGLYERRELRYYNAGQNSWAELYADLPKEFKHYGAKMTMFQGKVVVVQSGNLRYYNEEAKQWEEFEKLPGVLDQEKSWIIMLQGMRYAPVVFAIKRYCHGLFRGTIDWEHKTVTWKRQRISENVKTYFIGIMAAA